MKTTEASQNNLFRKSKVAVLALLLFAMIVMPISAVSAGSLNYAFTTIYINNLGDAGGGDCSNTAPGGVPAEAIGSCDLRSAIAEGNSSLGSDVIELDDEAVRKIIAGGGTLEIVLTGNIPTVSEELDMDLLYKNPNSGVESILPILAADTHGGFNFDVGATGSSLANVILQDIDGNGIRVLADGVSLLNITIEDTGGAVSAGHGVLVNSSAGFSLTNADISSHADGVRLVSVNGATLTNLILVGNSGNGAYFGSGTTGAVLQSSLIGARVSLSNVTTGDGNGGYGVFITNSYGNTVKTSLISDNGNHGIYVTDNDGGLDNGGTPNNTLASNKIGVDNKAEVALSNSGAGVYVNGVPNVKISGGVISGNTSHGVDIRKLTSTDASVSGIKIGTDGIGEAAIPNGGHGIFIRAAKLVSITNNLLSGNTTHGVYIGDDGSDGSTEVTVSGNTIGLEVDKQDALPNGTHGIAIFNSDTIIVSNNYIGSNTTHGLLISGSDDVEVTGNKIGISVTLQLRGNGNNGVRVIDSTLVKIGLPNGSGGNTIVGNARGVVSIDTRNQVSILGNSIHSNTVQDIDVLNDGQTVNDAFAVGGGGDDVENYPIITSASVDANTGDLRIDFTFDYGIPGEEYYFEFFYGSSCSPTGFGGGKTLLTFQTYNAYTTGFVGEVRESIVIPSASVPGALGEGSVITALVTNHLTTGGYADTSEFSACEYVLSSGVAGTSSHLIVNRKGTQSLTVAAKAAGVCDYDDGTPGPQCTLRAALEVVNDNINTYDIYTITFSISGGAPYVINETNTLEVKYPVIIDGTSSFFNGDPQVILNGPGSGSGRIGLDIQVAGAKVIGLVLVDYSEGIRINGVNNVTLRNNYMGIYTDGTEVPNSYGLVLVGANGNTISSNVISANLQGGVILQGSTGNTLDGNFVGTDGSGTAPRGNFKTGITISAGSSNVITGNIVADNELYGISIVSSSSNQITNNQIGGSISMGNKLSGIVIQADSNTVFGNSISGNQDDGIDVVGGVGNKLSQNYISNDGDNPAQDFRIDLGSDAATANDAGDGDSGANNKQNFPALTSAAIDPDPLYNYTYIVGTLNSTANRSFTIEFYGDDQYLGSTTVTTDGSGNAVIGYIYNTRLSSLTEVTSLTIDDSTNDTSEFSNAVYVVAGVVPTLTATPTPTSTPTATSTFTPVPTNTTAPGAPTNTPVPTNTSVPPTKTATVVYSGGLVTNTPIPPTATGNPTTTAIAATLTQLAVGNASSTPTATSAAGGVSTATPTYAFSFSTATATATSVAPTDTPAPATEEATEVGEGIGGGANPDDEAAYDDTGDSGEDVSVPKMFKPDGLPMLEADVMATLDAQAAIDNLPGVDYSNQALVDQLVAEVMATQEALQNEAEAAADSPLPMGLIVSICGGLLLLILLIFGGMELWGWLNSRED